LDSHADRQYGSSVLTLIRYHISIRPFVCSLLPSSRSPVLVR